MLRVTNEGISIQAVCTWRSGKVELAYLLAVDPFITMTYSPLKAAVGNSDVGINWRTYHEIPVWE